MGSPADEPGRLDGEKLPHSETVQAFAAGKYEVTKTEWQACVTDGGCASLQDDGFGGGRRPITNMTMEEAEDYSRWLSKKPANAIGC